MCGRKTNVHGGVAGFLLIGHFLYKIFGEGSHLSKRFIAS